LLEAPVFLQFEGIPYYVIHSWLAMIILIGSALLIRVSMSIVPVGIQNFIESIVEAFLKLTEDTIGSHWGRKFFPLIGALGLYILICNFMGLIPGFKSPTSNINTTASLALPVFLATHYFGVKTHGFGYIKHFLGPMRSIFALPLMILMFFIEFVGHLARPVTLSVRLFGNMIAKHLVLSVLVVVAFIVPAITIIPSAILNLFILSIGVLLSIIQSLVFVILTMLYLSGAVEAEEH